MNASPAESARHTRNRPTRTGRPTSRWGTAAYAALFIFLALIAMQCLRLGAAGLLVQTAQSEADRWTPAARAPGMAEIKRTAKFFNEGLDYTPDNPWALEGAGALHLARMRASRIPREAHAAARDARARFRQALLQRPTSPFLWANLALSKLYLDEVDGEMLAALRHADELGPWEPGVQQTVLFVGLALWPDLDPGMQQALVRTIERGAARNTVKMYEIAKSYTRFDLVCAIEKYRLIAGADCSRAADSGNAVDQGYRQ